MQHSTELYNLSKLFSATTGVVIREVPQSIVKLLRTDDDGDQSALLRLMDLPDKSPNQVKRLQYAQAVNDLLDTTQVCGNPLNAEFERYVTMGNYKDDQRLVLALRLYTAPNGQRDWVICGVAGWGAFDKNDEPEYDHLPPLEFVNPELQARNDDKLSEIDIICSRTGGFAKPGTGIALLARCLGMIAKTKQRGQRRFEGVVAYNIVNEHNNDVMPFERVGNLFGFEIVDAKREGLRGVAKGPTNIKKNFSAVWDSGDAYWEDTGIALLSNPTLLSLCPVAPRSGRSYCS